MNSISSLSPQQLRQAADIKERILSLQNELERLLGAPPEILVEAPRARRRPLSAQALANIRAGARKRVGRLGLASTVRATRRRKRKMSEAQKARLSAIAAARWKKVKAQGKNKL